METVDQKTESLKKTWRACMDSIHDMVNALNCDYDRLEELRELKADFEPGDSDQTWQDACPDEWEELQELESQAGDCNDRDDAETRIQEDPLSIEFRSGWVSSKDEMEAEEFCILLSTGGPASRIVGEIRSGQAQRPRLEVQDWGTSWTEFIHSSEDIEALETYCSQFCFDC